jgi:uncharacterized protein YidB (DUF937 family)
MPFDQQTRNRLQRFVADAREVLEDEFTRQLQNEYGLDPDHDTVTPIENLPYFSDVQMETARILRDTAEHYRSTRSGDSENVLRRVVREQSFTVLNRIVALRMAEARGIVTESVGNGYLSKGFQLYKKLANAGLGETGDAYGIFLNSMFDMLAQDLPRLFDRYSAQGRLFPREQALLQVLNLVNDSEMVPMWSDDEAIGWIFQYFNSRDERKRMREESQAPRNSRELAVRNQFFTPRYVVQFLVDNTLGRLWFEATGGATALRSNCTYLLVKPDEHPRPSAALRDPRTITFLDPACGSMHFGLYAFDLFLQIYQEAWQWEQHNGLASLDRGSDSEADLKPLCETYASEAAFLRDVPRLIIERNLYGVDIDIRATQIASLALWLRAQRAWHDAGVQPEDRPSVGQGHVVAAVAPPAEPDLEDAVAGTLSSLDAELFRKTLRMLKGIPETGVLLRVEQEVPSLIRQVYGERSGMFAAQDVRSWRAARQRLWKALTGFIEAAQLTYKGRLFSQDALEGLRLVELVERQYDVVVMNPPFGALSLGVKDQLSKAYPRSKNDLLAIFVERGLELLRPGGRLGAITSRTAFFLTTFEKWRKEVVLGIAMPEVFADLGYGVMDDAMVEAAAYVLEKRS